MIAIEDRLRVNRYDPRTTTHFSERWYTVFWIKDGVESIAVNGVTFPAQAHSIFFVARGSEAQLAFGAEPQGWILMFCSDVFLDVSANLIIKDADIFSSFGQVPRIILSPRISDRVAEIAEMIDEMSGSQIPNREMAVASLLRTLLIYCDSSCNVRLTDSTHGHGVALATQYKELVAEHYTRTHRVADYAAMMHISPKYLTEVTREILGTTPKSIIQEQLVIQARRELKFSNDSIKEIACKLGFSEAFHFSKFFKQQVGSALSAYRKQ